VARYRVDGGIATTPKFDNRKKIDFFKTIIDFCKKTKLTSLVQIFMEFAFLGGNNG